MSFHTAAVQTGVEAAKKAIPMAGQKLSEFFAKEGMKKAAQQAGQVFSREAIGKLIKIDKERSVDVIITRLRKKVEDDPKKPRFLQTVRGEGYVFWIE